jgi:hypothetical protein
MHGYDLHTLTAVIEQLQGRVDHCHEMIIWAYENQEKLGGTRDVDAWCNAKVEAKRCLEKVETMLENELNHRGYNTAVHEEAA